MTIHDIARIFAALEAVGQLSPEVKAAVISAALEES